MKPQQATSLDGSKVTFDQNGAGPAIFLLHGGGSNRQVWHEIGYVERLKKEFTVITLDLRGHGESSLPTDPEDYTTKKMGEDILAVADQCGIKEFIIWGMSFGGNVSRYLAVSSNRITKLIMMGTKLGPGATGDIAQQVREFSNKWAPIIQAQNQGTLDLNSLSPADRDFLLNFNVPVIMAWGRAMLAWPVIEPADLPCPTLWIIGSEDHPTMDNVAKFKSSLPETKVQLQIAEGLDHNQTLEEIDRVFPIMLEFSK